MEQASGVRNREYVFVDRFEDPTLQIVMPFGRLAISTDGFELYDLLVKYNGNGKSDGGGFSFSLSTRVPPNVMQEKFGSLRKPFENGEISGVYVRFSEQNFQEGRR